MWKTFLLQAIQFSHAVLIQVIQFSVSTVSMSKNSYSEVTRPYNTYNSENHWCVWPASILSDVCFYNLIMSSKRFYFPSIISANVYSFFFFKSIMYTEKKHSRINRCFHLCSYSLCFVLFFTKMNKSFYL